MNALNACLCIYSNIQVSVCPSVQISVSANFVVNYPVPCKGGLHRNLNPHLIKVKVKLEVNKYWELKGHLSFTVPVHFIYFSVLYLPHREIHHNQEEG